MTMRTVRATTDAVRALALRVAPSSVLMALSFRGFPSPIGWVFRLRSGLGMRQHDHEMYILC